MASILVLSRVFPPEVGGSGRWLWELYSRFPAKECIVVTRQSAEGARFDETHVLPVVRMALPSETWGVLGWRVASEYYRLYRELKNLVKEHQIHQVHAACVLPEGFLAWMLRRRIGLPYRVYVHGEELNIVGKSRELTWMACRVLRGAEQVIANSRNTAELLRRRWPVDERRIQVLQPGVDTSTYVPGERCLEARTRLGWGDRPVVLTVGRLQARKGQDHLIRALLQIRQQIPNVLYAIVGDGKDRSRLLRLVEELQLLRHVILHGALCDGELLEAYQQCDLFALPNREVNGDIEGFGLVLLEAQACGKPVLIGNSGGTRETIDVGVSGVVVDCGDPAVIARAVTELLGDPNRLDVMGEAGRDWVCRGFDWSVCVDKARQAYGLEPLNRHCAAALAE
jgi:phosphatidyl-myo-inositol dimannoside synthase